MGYASRRRWARRSAGPTLETWAVTGDGGFQMTSQELMTLAADRIPVKIAILDNKKLGMIRQWQEIIYAGNYHSAHLPGPGLRQARRGVRDPGLQGDHDRRGRPDDPGRPGGRRTGADLVRDRRGAERVPDDAGGQGPVRPDRDVGSDRGMSPDPGTPAAPAEPPAPPIAQHPAAHTAPPPRALPGTGQAARHILVVLVMDRPGVLNRVASLMRARNFNIDSLAVSRTDREHISRMTITIHGDAVAVEQAAKQLYRLIDVLKVQDVTERPGRGARAGPRSRCAPPTPTGARSSRSSSCTRARVVDISAESVIVEAHGTEAEIDALVALLRGYGIKELVRTGAMVMLRGAGSIEEALKL